jgi:hypothetical protein
VILSVCDVAWCNVKVARITKERQSATGGSGYAGSVRGKTSDNGDQEEGVEV